MGFYLQCFGRAWRDSAGVLQLERGPVMAAVLVWALAVLALWLVSWPMWFPGETDIGAELKLGLSAVLGLIVGFAVVFLFNLLLAPMKIYAEVQGENENLKDKMRPRLRLINSAGKPELTEFGAVNYDFSGGLAQIVSSGPREIVFVEIVNTSALRIDGCQAHVTAVRLKNPERDLDRFIEAHGKKKPRIVDHIPLRWVPISLEGFERASIPSGGRRRIEIVTTNGEYVHFGTEVRIIHYIMFFKPAFAYELDVSVTSDNSAPLFIRAHVDWNDDGVRCRFAEIDHSEALPEIRDVA